jgi:hypothetical protein
MPFLGQAVCFSIGSHHNFASRDHDHVTRQLTSP